MTGPSLPALSQSLLRRLRDRIPENIPANLLANIEFSTAKFLTRQRQFSRLARERSSRASWKTLCNWRISPAARWAGLSPSNASQIIDLLLFSDRTASTQSFCAAWRLSQSGPVFLEREKSYLAHRRDCGRDGMVLNSPVNYSELRSGIKNK